MKKSMILIVMAVLCLFLGVSAQGLKPLAKNIDELKPLNIGEKVPDLEFDQALNMPGGKLRFSDFKGKALILDFWGTWCGACLKAIPHAQEVQDKYGKNVQVLLINDSATDSLHIVREFLEKRKRDNQEIRLPVIFTHSKVTRKLFPHRHYPHYVWISADGRIKAITRAEQLEEDSIERLIAGLDIHIPVKQP